MKSDALKSAWKETVPQAKPQQQLKEMMQEKKHPVLKRIKRQLTIEIIIYSIFLFVYYDLFDGAQKPFYLNLLLVASVLLIILHNLTGYSLTKHPGKGSNLIQALKDHLSKMKVYAVVSIASRVIWATFLLLFLTYVIRFDAAKYWLLGGIVLVFILQLAALSAIWFKRVRKIKESLHEFTFHH